MTTEPNHTADKRADTIQAEALADRIAAQIQPLLVQLSQAYWRLYTLGDGEAVAQAQTLAKELDGVYADPALFAEVSGLRERGPIDDPLQRRRIDLLYLECLGRQGDKALLDAIVDKETELQQEFNTFRAELDGRRVADHEIQELLDRSDDNDARCAAWEASKQIGVHVQERVRELARLRNALARSQGFRDHFARGLALQELDEARLLDLFGRLDQRTAAPFRGLKATLDAERCARFRVAPAELRPWHYGDPFAQSVPSDAGGVDLNPLFEGRDIEGITTRFFADLGMEVGDIMQSSDLYPRDKKSQHAFCMDVDRAGDVRVLANIRPNQQWMMTMLHEFGHAVYDKYIDHALPFDVRTPAHTLTTEAIAMLMGRFAQRAAFLARYVATDFDADGLGRTVRWRQSLEMLTMARWVAVMVNFERELYRDPDRDDLNDVWWSLVERHQGIARPDDRRDPAAGFADWAAKIHIAIAPVYYQNYIMGEMMASQLAAALRRVTAASDFIGAAQAGRWLIDEVFAPGATIPWPRLIEQATGQPLSEDAFIAEFATPS